MNTPRPLVVLFLLFLLAAATVSAQEPIALETVDGIFEVIWGDPPPDTDLPAVVVQSITTDSGESIRLGMSEELRQNHGEFLTWAGRRVRVHFDESSLTDLWDRSRKISAMQLLPQEKSEAQERAVMGSKPWVSILCKFSNIAAEPQPLSYFTNMYGNSAGRLNHYWRKQSFEQIDVVGSVAIDWVDLPKPQTDYIPTPGNNHNSDLNALFDDCTAAADPFVDFSNGGTPFEGINQMFNDVLDCCAWGGSRFASLDGITKSWRVTWEPPWGYRDVAVMGHEMGHGFGLPHSNNWDGDSSPYDSPWDVMSAAQQYTIVDGTYGRRGKHTIAYHKDRLGWIPEQQRMVVETNMRVTVVIDDIARQNTTNYRMAQIPIPESNRFYTVETRRREGDYDGNLPGTAIILHEVDPFRSEPAWAIDGDPGEPSGFGDDEGTMWRAGETFEDAVHSISITIDAATAQGFLVTINTLTDILFADGFESGNTAAW